MLKMSLKNLVVEQVTQRLILPENVLLILIIIVTHRDGYCCYAQFSDEETEAQN